MKKYGKGIALVLVFALVFGMFAGLGLYGGSSEAMAKAAYEKGAHDYLILEIVPDEAAASFDPSGLNGIPSDDTAVVIKCTPTTLDGADFKLISQADMFVIHQSDDYKFKDKDLSWKAAYEIFKRVVGVSGNDRKSARYIMEQKIFTEASKSSFTWNPRFMLSDGMSGFTGKNSYSRPYNDEGGTGSKTVAYSNNAAKLYMMLELMDPGTFYGLYCLDLHEAQKIDVNTGDFLTYGPDSSNICDLQEPDYRIKEWAPQIFIPFYLGITSRSDVGMDIDANNETKEKINVNQSYKRGYVYSGSLSGAISGYNSKSFNTVKNNGHTYRIAVVSPNKSKGARTTIAKGILAAAIANGESLVGGLDIKGMSMAQFAGDTDSLDKYDVIYFENDDNPDDVWARNNKVYGKYTASQTFNVKNAFKRSGSTTVHYAGLDITSKQLTELNNFSKPVVVSKALKNSSKISASNIKTYLDSFPATTNGNKIIDSGSLNVADLKSKIDTIAFNMEVISTPTIYAPALTFNWNNQDKYEDYYTSLGTTSDSDRYLQKTGDSYKLEFEVKLSNSADVYIYIDTDNDARFDDETAHKIGDSVSGYQKLSYNLGAGKSGAVYWKLEAKTSAKSSYITGCSAIKSSGKQKLNILQIIPCDENGSLWGNNDDSADVSSVSLVLPMKSEIEAASKKNRVNGTSVLRGSIADYDIFASSSQRWMVDTYFDGAIKIQVKGQAVDFDHSSYSTIKYSDDNGVINKNDWTANADGNVTAQARPKAILSGAGLFYYFLEKTGMYDLNVLRISTLEFAERLALDPDGEYGKYKIYQDEEKGTLYYMDPTTENAETPTYVGCDLLFMGGSSRFLDPSDYSNNVFKTTAQKTAWTNAVTAIKKYLSNSKNPAYIANGVINPENDDDLSNALLGVMGMERYGTNNIENYTHAANNFKRRNNGGVAEAVKTNDGAMTSYPYSIPSDLRVANSASASVTYQLALDNSNDISVFFATAGISTGANFYNTIGDAINNYYLYKKGNITFSSMGFNFGNSWGQKAFAIKIPEAALLVNAITNSANPDNNDPVQARSVLKFIDKKDGSLIVGYDDALPLGNSTTFNTETRMPAGYGWNKTTDPIVVKKNGAIISTVEIKDETIEAGKLKSFKFKDPNGFSGTYEIEVKVSRPSYVAKIRYKGDGSIINTATGYLNYGQNESGVLSISVPGTGLSSSDTREIHSSITSKPETSYAISLYLYSLNTVSFKIRDNNGFDGEYEVIFDFEGEYIPQVASYKIFLKTEGGVIIGTDPVASGDLEYDSDAEVTLDTVSYDKDMYEYKGVETDKGSVSATHSLSAGTVTCKLKDSNKFKNEYNVYVILKAKEVEQPPIPTIKVQNPDKTETKDEGLDSDGDGTKDGIIDTVPADPNTPPSPSYDPADPSTGIQYVKYTDYLYPDYETINTITGVQERVAEGKYLYKNDAGQYVMRVEFKIDLGKDSTGSKVPAIIDVQVNDPNNATKRASLGLTVHQGSGHASDSNKVTDNKIVADGGNVYFVEVPITSGFYSDLAAAGKLNDIDASNFGMDIVDGFGVTIVAKPEGSYPYGVKTRINFVKRGMFRLD